MHLKTEARLKNLFPLCLTLSATFNLNVYNSFKRCTAALESTAYIVQLYHRNINKSHSSAHQSVLLSLDGHHNIQSEADVGYLELDCMDGGW